MDETVGISGTSLLKRSLLPSPPKGSGNVGQSVDVVPPLELNKHMLKEFTRNQELREERGQK